MKTQTVSYLVYCNVIILVHGKFCLIQDICWCWDVYFPLAENFCVLEVRIDCYFIYLHMELKSVTELSSTHFISFLGYLKFQWNWNVFHLFATVMCNLWNFPVSFFLMLDMKWSDDITCCFCVLCSRDSEQLSNCYCYCYYCLIMSNWSV